jgi:hypothetical protein
MLLPSLGKIDVTIATLGPRGTDAYEVAVSLSDRVLLCDTFRASLEAAQRQDCIALVACGCGSFEPLTKLAEVPMVVRRVEVVSPFFRAEPARQSAEVNLTGGTSVHDLTGSDGCRPSRLEPGVVGIVSLRTGLVNDPDRTRRVMRRCAGTVKSEQELGEILANDDRRVRRRPFAKLRCELARENRIDQDCLTSQHFELHGRPRRRRLGERGPGHDLLNQQCGDPLGIATRDPRLCFRKRAVGHGDQLANVFLTHHTYSSGNPKRLGTSKGGVSDALRPATAR